MSSDKKPVPAHARADERLRSMRESDDEAKRGAAAVIDEATKLLDAGVRPLVISESIPVAVVRFDRPLQFPGKQQDDHARSITERNGNRWVVDYVPALAMFRIDYADKAHPERSRVGYVPAAHVLSWEPA